MKKLIEMMLKIFIRQKYAVLKIEDLCLELFRGMGYGHIIHFPSNFQRSWVYTLVSSSICHFVCPSLRCIVFLSNLVHLCNFAVDPVLQNVLLLQGGQSFDNN